MRLAFHEISTAGVSQDAPTSTSRLGALHRRIALNERLKFKADPM
jgi:hypothetical protein